MAERVGAEDVEPVVADMRGGTGHRVQELLHGGADAVLGRAAARRWPAGLCGTREIEEVRALGVVELQRASERFEHAVGGAGEVAALQARVVGGAHPGQDGDFLVPQTGHAALAVVGQADVGGLEPGSPGGQELADLAAGVHRFDQRRAAHPVRGTLAGSRSQGLSSWPKRCFRIGHDLH